MLYVALVEAAIIAVLVYLFAGILRSVQRENGRNISALIDRVLHVSGNPWNLAPADEFVPPPRSLYDDEGELLLTEQYARYTPTPEQEP